MPEPKLEDGPEEELLDIVFSCFRRPSDEDYDLAMKRVCEIAPSDLRRLVRPVNSMNTGELRALLKKIEYFRACIDARAIQLEHNPKKALT